MVWSGEMLAPHECLGVRSALFTIAGVVQTGQGTVVLTALCGDRGRALPSLRPGFLQLVQLWRVQD